MSASILERLETSENNALNPWLKFLRPVYRIAAENPNDYRLWILDKFPLLKLWQKRLKKEAGQRARADHHVGALFEQDSGDLHGGLDQPQTIPTGGSKCRADQLQVETKCFFLRNDSLRYSETKQLLQYGIDFDRILERINGWVVIQQPRQAS